MKEVTPTKTERVQHRDDDGRDFLGRDRRPRDADARTVGGQRVVREYPAGGSSNDKMP